MYIHHFTIIHQYMPEKIEYDSLFIYINDMFLPLMKHGNVTTRNAWVLYHSSLSMGVWSTSTTLDLNQVFHNADTPVYFMENPSLNE